MQEAHGTFEDTHQHLPSCVLGLLVIAIEPDLGHLDEPIAILAPQEVVDLPPRLAEVVILKKASDLGDEAVVAT